VHRVLVKDGDTILGILSQLDLMSFMSNHSHLITLQVEQARTVEDLRKAALSGWACSPPPTCAMLC